MDRRLFIKNTGLVTGGLAIGGNAAFTNGFPEPVEPWFDKSMRWAQLAFVENDPEKYAHVNCI